MSPFNLTRFNVIFFTAVVAALVAAGVTYETGRATTISDAFSRLTLFHGLRKATVEDYMLSKTSDMKAMSRNDRVIDALSAFNAAWSELPGEPANEARRLYIKDNPFRAGKKGTLRSANDGSGYTAVHREFHDWARRFLEHFGYYDLFLIDASGNVVYSAEKEDDYGTNLMDGPYSETPLGYVFQRAVRRGAREVIFSDYEHYAPSGNIPAAFAGSRVLTKDKKLLGIFAVQLPAGPLNDMLRSTAGMGKSGKTYIVGNDLLMRSQSRFIDEPTFLKTKVDTEAARNGLQGFAGSREVRDYRNIPVLSVYSALDFGGQPWVLLAEMDKAEAMSKLRIWPALLAGLIAGFAAAMAAHLACNAIMRD